MICQDTTRYGDDIYGDSHLVELAEALNAIDGDFKFQTFYMYPDTLTFGHLERLSKLEKLIPYFDIPFQHYSANVLRRMGRFYDQNHISELLSYIRKNFTGAFIRTSFIIGFPGESDAEFEELCEFVKKEKFGNVGIFQYHDEPLASSSKLDSKVNDVVARTRIKKMDKILDVIYREHAKKAKRSDVEGYATFYKWKMKL